MREGTRWETNAVARRVRNATKTSEQHQHRHAAGTEERHVKLGVDGTVGIVVRIG